jgi:hypothetical protein
MLINEPESYLVCNTELHTLTFPVYVGGWKIGGNWTINVIERPTDEQIINTEKMFGWEWVEK